MLNIVLESCFIHIILTSVSEVSQVFPKLYKSPQSKIIHTFTSYELYYDTDSPVRNLQSEFHTLRHSLQCELRLIQTNFLNDHGNLDIRKHLELTSSSYQNPTFIFFLVSKNFTPSFNKLCSELHQISLTSKYFTYNVQSGETFIVNLIASETRLFDHLIPIKNSLTSFSLNKLWFQIHKDLGEGDVCCEAYEADFLLDEFSDLLNYSRKDDETDWMKTLGHIWRRTRQSHEVIYFFLSHHRIDKWHWSPYATYREHFTFTVFSNRLAYDPTLLTKPFDSSIWIFILISILSISFVVNTKLKNRYKQTSPSFFIGSVLWTTGLLLDNPEGFIAKRLTNHHNRKSSLGLNVPISLFILLSIVLTHSYKGCIFFLAKDKPPFLPKTFEELAHFDMKSVTPHDQLKSYHFTQVKENQPRLSSLIRTLDPKVIPNHSVSFKQNAN